jgi:hypothetical protein
MDQSPIAAVVAPEAKSHARFVSQLTSSGFAGPKRQGLSVKSTKLLTLAAVGALAGCSASAKQPQARCEVMTEPICSRVAETRLNDGTLTVNYASRLSGARVIPFAVPVFRTDGVLAAEVDCYTNTDARTYRIVRSDLAIPPSSQESVDFLKDRHLCAEKGLYTENTTPGATKKLLTWQENNTLLADALNFRYERSNEGQR